MQDPLKQGLKPILCYQNMPARRIRMQDPLKQGLKLKEITFGAYGCTDSNARSIKTRIETFWISF